MDNYRRKSITTALSKVSQNFINIQMIRFVEATQIFKKSLLVSKKHLYDPCIGCFH